MFTVVRNNIAKNNTSGFGRVPDPDIFDDEDDDIYDPEYDWQYVPKEQNKIGAVDFLTAWTKVCKDAGQNCENCPVNKFCITDDLHIAKVEQLQKFVRACMVSYENSESNL